MSVHSNFRKMMNGFFSKKNFNFIIVGLIILIFVFLAIGNYNLRIIEGMNESDVHNSTIIDSKKKLSENFQDVLELESITHDKSEEFENIKENYEKEKNNRYDTLKNNDTTIVEGFTVQPCESNFPDPSNSGSNETFNTACESIKRNKDSNKSLLNNNN